MILALVVGLTGFFACGPAAPEAPKIPERERRAGAELPPGAISYRDGLQHIGEEVTVCGPVTSAELPDPGDPSELYIGGVWPQKERFEVIIPVEIAEQFPERPYDYFRAKSICVTGTIVAHTEPEGYDIARIVIDDPDQIQIQ